MKDVIIACDFKNKQELYKFLKIFNLTKPFLKIGMELFYKEGPELITELKALGYKIFLDLKLHDIPTTVQKAMNSIAHLNVEIVNVHAAGGIEMMKAAKQSLAAFSPKTKVIAVTQLTSTSQIMLENELLIKEDIANVVKHYAANAKTAGLDGVVCSPLEVPIIKKLNLLTVTPGIRFNNDSRDDQKRIASPNEARDLGVDYIVVGRSITAALNPLAIYEKCCKEFLWKN